MLVIIYAVSTTNNCMKKTILDYKTWWTDTNKKAEVATDTNKDLYRELKLIKWDASTMGRVELNTDGARDKHGKASCGDIIRGNEGEWLRGFSKYIGICDNYTS